MPERDEKSIGFTDFSEFFEGVIKRAWELDPDPEAGDPKALLADLWTLMRAFTLGPAGVSLLLTPRNREMLHRMLYVYGLVDKRKDEGHEELKELAKSTLLAWLELADEGRRHRHTLWEINNRLWQKFGEAIDEVTAEFAKRQPSNPRPSSP